MLWKYNATCSCFLLGVLFRAWCSPELKSYPLPLPRRWRLCQIFSRRHRQKSDSGWPSVHCACDTGGVRPAQSLKSLTGEQCLKLSTRPSSFWCRSREAASNDSCNYLKPTISPLGTHKGTIDHLCWGAKVLPSLCMRTNRCSTCEERLLLSPSHPLFSQDNRVWPFRTAMKSFAFRTSALAQELERVVH